MKAAMMMKRLSIFALGMAMLAGCSSGAPKASTTASATEEKAATGGSDEVLRIGVECAYPPFNWTQNGEEVPGSDAKAEPIAGTSQYTYGYDVAVAQKLADQLGMDLEVHKSEWDSIGMGLDVGDYDAIISGMGRTAKRQQSYSFTDPYYYRTNCLVVKKGSGLEDVKGLSDLAGKNVKITTQTGTGWVDLLDQIPDGVPSANYATTSECFMAIANGVADVCVIDKPTALAAQSTNPDLVIIDLAEDDKFKGDEEMTNICIATRKDDTELKDKLQKALEDMGWTDKAAMDELMEEMIVSIPSSN